ncbi:pilus assembly protein TadG-related protein [Asticcacaulis sp.]|uniref:pilus assembly protein TadG-related protein n=1 Tax=Asticcacaulis sp. TaxID=1872648 RepID=UPI002D1BC484|nr:pilus assembly protein TadG-related protein [Asticcacaulis sp.]HTM83162.1 pilus assembly protein TadG-related protein [Asticcacaulis sp.]
MRAFLSRFGRDKRGSVLIMGAGLMIITVGLAAFAVDMGYVYVKSRELQGTADLAAMSAAANLSTAESAAQAVVMANARGDAITVKTQTGFYDATVSKTPSARFKVTPVAGANAAQVTVSQDAGLFFGRMLGQNTAHITRTATASSVKLAAFSIGTRLASVNGGVANALLSGLTGSSVNLTVMDYNSLAGAKIDLLKYVEALHTHANLTAATFDQSLASDITVGDALTLLVDQADTSAKAPLKVLANSAIKSTKIKLSDLVDIGAYGGQDRIVGGADAAISIDSLTMAKAILLLANQDRQVQLDLGAQAPGLAGLKAYMAIGERPSHSAWLTVTRTGEPIIRTAQARLYLDASLVPGLTGVSLIHVPLYIELASAQGRLSNISCNANKALNSVTLALSPGIGQASIGTVNTADLSNFKKTLVVSPAQLVAIPLVGGVSALSQIKIGGTTWQTATFSANDIANQTVRTVRTNDAVTSIGSSLITNTHLTPNVLGLGIGLDLVTTTLGKLIAGLGPVLDPVINALLDQLGVGLGEVDAQVNGLRCSGAALVI